LEIKGLKKYYTVGKNILGQPTSLLKAVDDVSFSVGKGEVFGLIGESGCGKTTIGKLVCGLIEPTGGEILFSGEDLTKLTPKQRRMKCTDIQFVFQDPYASLNPRMTIGKIIAEPMLVNGLASRGEVNDRVDALLEDVGLRPSHKARYPHEFSGGQRQRVGIARALAVSPKFIVCDEPGSALDVSIQAQVLNLLADLREKFKLTYIFIAHGLGAIKYLSDRVGVMYLGKMMEITTKAELYERPLNPYTKALLSAIPIPDPTVERSRIPLTGDVATPIDPKPGCRFASRCYAAQDVCRTTDPVLREMSPGHACACHFPDAPLPEREVIRTA